MNELPYLAGGPWARDRLDWVHQENNKRFGKNRARWEELIEVQKKRVKGKGGVGGGNVEASGS